MSYRGRFAPSPTGPLHLGSLVAALGSWLRARQAGGAWLVRMEDLDPPREVPGAVQGILSALPAFGLEPAGPVLFQSTRHGAYRAAFEHLRETRRIFPCWCSRSDLADTGGIHRDGRCVAAPATDRPPAWRLRVPDLEVAFTDGLAGPQRQNLRDEAGDFVIWRVEDIPAYQLACVVDDAFQGMTEVVRGMDLLDSTPRQIYLQQCLGLSTPRYLHLPLVRDDSGRKLSKSTGALAIDPRDPLPAVWHALDFLGLAPSRMQDSVAALLDETPVGLDVGLLSRCSGHMDV